MLYKKLVGVLGMSLSAIFVGCGESEVTLNYKLAQPVDVEVYTESYFATIDLKGDEQMGTITAAYVDLNYSTSGDTTKVKRLYRVNNSRGYLKNFMPSELAWRVKEVDLAAIDRDVIAIDGLDEGYDTLLAHIPMPERCLRRLEKHRWEMDHLLTGTVPVKANITQMLKDQGRLNFALIKIDSVVTRGFENRDHRHCLDYKIYLHETESFPYYIWEQHVNSKIVPEKFMAYNSGLKAEYDTEYEVMMDPETGVPCQEREVKVGKHTMVNPVTKDTATFVSHITHERLYNIKRAQAAE